MTRFILSILMLASFSAAFSQRLYFIYLQSEPEQPFFVKLNEKVNSSTASGYLILSRLRDSSFNFSVGFPQNKWPEQKFTIDIKAKDHGYLLKNFGEKGWGLFDLQTATVQMGLSAVNNSPKTEQGDVSVFTDILSRAANDPSLKEKPIAVKMEDKTVSVQPAVIKEEKKPVIEQAIVKEDQEPVIKREEPLVKKEEPLVISNDQPVKTEEVKNIPVEEYKRSFVTRKSESSTSEGFGLTFIDEYPDGKKDTIRIIIPNQKISIAEIKEQPKEEKKFLDVSANDTAKSGEPGIKPANTKTLPAATVAKNGCSSLASETDFLKLRKKMAAETTDDGMVGEAKKYFKTKCFTVIQLKNLSTLFLNDAGKYKFLDTAYSYASDQENFLSLAAELKDEYYINRFKAMLRN
jgi:hypothetical protein